MKKQNNINTVFNLNFIDLFAGIGGFHLALNNVLKKFNNINSNCLLVSEIDSSCIKVYKKNFPKTINNEFFNIKDLYKDRKTLKELKKNNFNFLFAGFPCQPFSLAGKKLGFKDKKNGNFFDNIKDILIETLPNFFILENVKGLYSHNNGKTYKTIIKELKKLNYIVPEINFPLIFSPEDINIAQNRQRIYIVGIHKNFNNDVKKINKVFETINIYIKNQKNKNKLINFFKKDFFEKNINKNYLINKKNNKNIYNAITAWDNFIAHFKKKNIEFPNVLWAFEFNNNDDNLDNLASWKKNYILKIKEFYKQNKKFIDKWMLKYNVNQWKKREQKLEWSCKSFPEYKSLKDVFIQLRQSGIRCKNKNILPTLLAIPQIPIFFDKTIKNGSWRFLTTKEVAKLQSFNKDFKKYDDIFGLDNNRNIQITYKHFGNSINIKILEIILEFLFKKIILTNV